MSLTPEERAQLALRDTLTTAERAVLSSTLNDMAFSARSHRVVLAFDDRIARLECALVRYIIDSRQ